MLACDAMSMTRATFTVDESLLAQARNLGVNISGSAREGVAAAVRDALLERDHEAYLDSPESVDEFWEVAEAWIDVGDEVDAAG